MLQTNTFTKVALGLGAAAAATFATTEAAGAHGRRGNAVGAIIGGVVAGAIIGGAINNNAYGSSGSYYYRGYGGAPRPVYTPPRPRLICDVNGQRYHVSSQFECDQLGRRLGPRVITPQPGRPYYDGYGRVPPRYGW